VALYDASVLAAESTHWDMERLSALCTLYANCNNAGEQHNYDHLGYLTLRLFQHYLFTAFLEFDTLVPAIHLLQQEDVWDDLVQHMTDQDPGWNETIVRRYPSDQHDYLRSLLESNTDDQLLADQISTATRQVGVTQITKVMPATSKRDEVQRRIDQVRQVLPDFGPGFLETALAYKNGNVEQTIQLLLNDPSQWPASLQVMDRSLPRRLDKNKINEEEQRLAQQLTKATLQAAQRAITVQHLRGSIRQ
jgi:hypothetical protein